MMMVLKIWGKLLLVFILSASCEGSLVEFPAETCSVDEMACDIKEDNLITSISDVSDVEECKQHCADTDGCQYISYFGTNSFPFHDYCMIFSNCSTLHDCENCMTEDKICFETCSGRIEGPLGDNVLEIIPNVEEEPACKLSCNSNSNCNFYTYYNSDDQYNPNLCILLTEIEQPCKECDFCRTGLPDCRNPSDNYCKFSVEEEGFRSLYNYYIFQFTNTSVNVSFLPFGCDMNILGIGGGGQGGYYQNLHQGPGGGSGMVSFLRFSPEKDTELRIKVGGRREETSLETVNGETLLTAKPGGRADIYYGGDGYSGGGGSSATGATHGGSDGSDGNYYGGRGSGLDIGEFELRKFLLSPGDGGYGNYGGGGGGVLIDGEGPPATDGQGKGYGGGGEGGPGEGPLPGVLILEMRKKL